MRRTLSLVLAGVIAVFLGAFGSVALASSLTGSSSDAAKTAPDSKPAVYGTR